MGLPFCAAAFGNTAELAAKAGLMAGKGHCPRAGQQKERLAAVPI
jgi:hypothetical protein